MKKFLGRFFASFLALCLFSFLAIIAVISLLAVMGKGYATMENPMNKKGKYVLVLSAHKPIVERSEEDDFPLPASKALDRLKGDDLEKMSFEQFQQALQWAAKDDKIGAVFIVSELFNSNGFSVLFRMREALEVFRKTSGKKIYAYGNLFEKSYLLASVADSIFAPQGGFMEWDGFAWNTLFFKNLIDRLGVNMHIFYAGKFKSATEPYRRDRMSEENKIQMQEFLSFFYDKFLATISQARHIKEADLRAYADELSVKSMSIAKNLHFIDAIKEKDEVEDLLKDKMGNQHYRAIGIQAYYDFKQAMLPNAPTSDAEIAVVYANGEIVKGREAEVDQVQGKAFASAIKQLAEDDKVKGIVLRVNSPGGDVEASEDIYRAVAFARKCKPVVVSFGSVAASGGYYIASAADYIIADPLTITGSIGVFMMIPNFQHFAAEKIGITMDGIKTGKNTLSYARAPLPIIDKPTPAQAAFMQASVDSIYLIFKNKVMQARQLSMSAVEQIAQGRIWTADKALHLGLVDTLGYLKDAIACVAKRAGVQDYAVRAYPKVKGSLARLFGSSKERVRTAVQVLIKGNKPLSVEAQLLEMEERLRRDFLEARTLMRLPFDISL